MKLFTNFIILAVLFFQPISAQTLIATLQSNEIDDCGSQGIQVTLNNTSGIDFINGTFSITFPSSISYSNNFMDNGDGSPTEGTTSPSMAEINFAMLGNGEAIDFNFDVLANCATGDDISVNVNYEEGGVAQSNNAIISGYMVNSPSFTIASSPSAQDIALGSTFSITNTLTNSSTADAMMVTYCVENNNNVTLQSLTVGGSPGVPAASPPVTGSSCYDIGLVANMSNVTIIENWLTTSCAIPEDDINRLVDYTCDGSTFCNGAMYADFPATNLSENDPVPPVSISITNDALISICGPVSTICIDITNLANPTTLNAPIQNISGTLDLPTGIPVFNLTEKAGGTVTMTGSETFDISDISAGETLSFSVDIKADCDVPDGSFLGNPFTLNFDPLCESAIDEITETFDFSTKVPNISMPASTPAVVEGFVGDTMTISTTIINGSQGGLDTFYYCLNEAEQTNLSLAEITVGGLQLNPAPAGVEPGMVCYYITSVEVAAAGLNVPWSNQNMEVIEKWEVIDCEEPNPDIFRRSQFGCQGNFDCRDKPDGDFLTSGVLFTIPLVSASFNSIDRPACYVNTPSNAVFTISNSGLAPAEEIVITVNGNGGSLSNYSLTHSDPMEILETGIDVITAADACVGGDGIYRDTIRNANIDPGETITVEFTVSYNCNCNLCTLSNIYNPTLSINTYIDNCGDDFSGNTAGAGAYNANMSGFQEAPLNLVSGETGTVEYTVTGVELSWFNNANYPRAYFEKVFEIPCGLDYVPGSVIFQDANGMVFPTCSIIAPDSGGDDEVIIRWCNSDYPAGFTISSAMEISIDVVADCSEKPIPPDCASPVFPLLIKQSAYFSTDSTCAGGMAPCTRQKIQDTITIETRIVCPQPGCGCEGMGFDNFTVERTNFGFGDTNNDQVPDGNIDLNTVQKDRFLQGDTLKATFEGTIRNPMGTFYQNGYAVLDFGNANYTPLSASVFIRDADGMDYMCNAVPVSIEMDTLLVIDFSLAGLNANGCGPSAMSYNFDDGDSISVCINFIFKDPFDEMVRDIIFDTEFYVSANARGDAGHMAAQCTGRSARMSQIGLSEGESCSVPDFGACDLPSWSFSYSRHYGSSVFDEFAFEIRPLGLPKEFTFTKPSEFEYRPDVFGIELTQTIPPENDIVNTTIPETFLVFNGNEVTFLAESYFNSLGNSEIAPDEGYSVSFYPRIQGSCLSESNQSYDISFSFSESVDQNVYCTPMIMRPEGTKTITYGDAAKVSVRTERENVRLCAVTEIVGIIVSSENPPTAMNAFLNWESVNGSVVVSKLVDPADNSEIFPNQFGIYELGDLPGGTNKRYLAHIRANDCLPGTISFVAGWDCQGYPSTVEEAICSDPSVVNFTLASTGFEIEPFTPGFDLNIPLCDTVTFEVEVKSTDLGYARDIILNANFPPGLTFVHNSFGMAYLSANPANAPFVGTIQSFPDPDLIPGGFTTNISILNSILDEEGLVGTKNNDSSRVSIIYKAVTDCDFINGSSVNYTATANSSCGAPLPPVRKESRSIFVTPDVPSFEAQVDVQDLELNPCNSDQTTSFVNINITGGNTTVNVDSVQYVLPPGLTYVPGTYSPILNAPPFGMGSPNIRTIGGNQVLSWPINTSFNPGEIISFRLDIIANDIGQVCTETRVRVLAFSRTNVMCGMDVCSIATVAGEAYANISIVKPQLVFNNFESALTLISTTNETLNAFSIEICNNGAVLQSGQSVTFDIYEDVDRNGSRSGPDILLTSISQVLTTPLGPGECITLSGEDTFPSGTVCTIIGVLDPNTTCTCSEEPSFQVMPEIIYEFETDYEVCSGDIVSIGPNPVNNYNYEWLSYNGSPLSALSDPNTTMTDFSYSNTSGSSIEFEYVLRSSYSNCYLYDTVSVLVYPVRMDIYNVEACINSSYQLPSPNIQGSNYIWTPLTGLTFPSGDSSLATINTVLASETYTLSYSDDGGCPSSVVYNITAVDCGTAVASLGDTVWFDFNMDGFQDPNEPGIDGVVVNLINGNTGAVLSTTVTDSNGYYNFGNLVQGNYQVQFIPLPGFIGTLQDQGGTSGQDSLDSDAIPDINNPNFGLTGTYFIEWGEHDPTVDAGFIPNCSLDVQLAFEPCLLMGDTLSQEVNVSINWDGNPYTYDQFGVDTLEINIPAIGYSQQLVIDTLFGDTVITFFINPSNEITLLASASFLKADLCTATSNEIILTPCVHDLALKKTASNGPNFMYGDTICLEIVVFNQGEQHANNIEVVDYSPSGFLFLSDQNPQWIESSGNYLTTISDTLAPGESDTISMKVELIMSPGIDAYTNYAEIASFQDTLGNDVSDQDVDSTPDMDNTNDSGGQPDSPADNHVDGNGMGTVGGDDAGTDEDDHDPFKVNIFDLALKKTIETPPPYNYGDEIDFKVMYYNQGNVPISEITINDYIPAGFSWLTVNEPDWSFTAGGAAPFDLATTTLAGTLIPGDSAMVTIKLQLEDAATDQYVNISEIANARDEDGNIRYDDFDSSPDNDPTNDAGGNPGTTSDNVVNGNGSGNPGDTDPGVDEDDADPAFVSIPLIDIQKSTIGVIPATSGVEGHFDATFELLITNTGNQKLTCILLQDDLTEQLGGSFVNIISPPLIVPVTTATTEPSIVPGYNGGVIDTIFNGTEGCLLPDELITVQFTAELTSITGPEPTINEVFISAKDTLGVTVSDIDTSLVDLPECYLLVQCPIDQIQLECINEIPGSGTTIAWFNAIDGISAIQNSCGVPTITVNDTNNGGTGCVASPYILTRQIIIMDPGDGSSPAESDTCEIIYTVIDDVKPIVMNDPIDLILQCGDTGNAAAITAWEMNDGGGIAVDACGIPTISFVAGTPVATCGVTSITPYSFTASDGCGNFVVRSAQLIIIDTIVPTLTLPAGSATVSCASSPDPEDWASTATAADDCDASPNIDIALINHETICNGTTTETIFTYRFIAVDDCGNESTPQTATYTIFDNVTPAITAPAALNVTCGQDLSLLVTEWLDDYTITDNCSDSTNLMVTNDYDASTVMDLCGTTIPVTWTLRNACGATTTAMANIIISNDITGPEMTCLDTLFATLDIDNCGAVLSVPLPQVFDCDGVDSVKQTNPLPGVEFTVGETIVTFTAWDACGNMSTCETIVVVEDTQNPELACPPSINRCVETGMCFWTGDASVNPVSTDCGNTSLTYSITNPDASVSTPASPVGYQFQLGSSVVTVTATDDSDPGNTSSCTYTVTVSDCEAPMITTCPAPQLTVECGSEDINTWAGTLVANDNCDVSLDVQYYPLSQSEGCGNTISYTYIFIVSDDNGNSTSCTSTYTVVDTTDPSIMPMAANESVECTDTSFTAFLAWIDNNGGAVASDACSTGAVTWTNDWNGEFVTACGGDTDIQVTFTATDDCGNTATSSATFTISDSEIPSVIAPSPLTLQCGNPNNEDIVTIWLNSVQGSDDCSQNVSVTNDYSLLPSTCDGMVTVTFTATDACGLTNTTTSTITLIDLDKPIIMNAPIDTILECGSPTLAADIASWAANFGNGTARDDCDSNIDITFVPGTIVGMCGNTSTTEYIFTATDDCGNSITEVAYLIIIDTTPPNAICVAPFTIELDASGQASLTVDDINDGSSDLCTDMNELILSITPSEFDANDLGDNLVTLTVEDGCGIISTCQTTVTVSGSPLAGLAKREVSVEEMSNGCKAITYEFNIVNYGNIRIDSLQVSDNLVDAGFNQCGGYSVLSLTSSDYQINPMFDGEIDTTLLLGSDQLQFGDQGSILLTVEICGCPDGTMVSNSAALSGGSPEGDYISDNSYDGSDPDDGDGDPTNDESDTETTLGENGVIGLAKRVVRVNQMTDGCTEIEYEFNLENFGNVDLDSVQIIDALDTMSLNNCTEFSVVSITSDDFEVNADFNGVTDTLLLNGNDLLQVTNKGAVNLIIESCGCPDGTTIVNQAQATGNTPGGDVAMDDSVNGSNPDDNNNGNPNDDQGNTTVTIGEDPGLFAEKNTLSVTPNGDGSYDVLFEVLVRNTGGVQIENLQISDTLSNTFPAPCMINFSTTSTGFTLNGNYGMADDWDLLDGTDILGVNQEESVYINATVSDCTILGMFTNTANISGQSPSGEMLEEEVTSDINLSETPVIGIAKRVADASLNSDGSFTVLYELNIENFGDVELDSIQVVDSLNVTFGMPCSIDNIVVTSGEFQVNPNYGVADDWNLLLGNDSLGVLDEGSILLEVSVSACDSIGPFNNRASVSGVSPTGSDATDNSVNGSDPDPGGDGPGNDEGDTPVDFTEEPNLGLAKYVKSAPVSNGDGTYNMSYSVRLENNGNVNISDLQIVDSLIVTFGGCAYSVELSSEEFAVNTNYDGDLDANLLSSNQELKSWDEGEICLDIVFGPCDSLGPFFNIAVASGMTPTGTEVMDTSHNGSNPDPEGDGPGDNSDPTGPVFFPENPQLTITKDAVSAVSNGDGSYSLVYEINIENTGDVQLNNVQLSDTLSNAFADPCIINYNVTSGRFTLNPNYGVADDWSLFDGLDTLQAGDQGSVLINVTVSDCGSVGTFNNVAMSTATSPSDSMVVSMDDADVTLAETPVIGIAKRVADASLNSDGSFTVLYELNIENFGDVELDSIQVVDSLNVTFGMPCSIDNIVVTSGEFQVNPNYGVADDWNLLLGNDSLGVLDEGSILLEVSVSACDSIGPFNNRASVSGVSPTGSDATDNSVNGSDPDPGGDGPGNDEGDTPVDFTEEPNLGLAKYVKSAPVSNGDGTYNMSYSVRLENNGNVNISDLQIVDSLIVTYGGCAYSVELSSEEFAVNTNYDGDLDANLLSSNQELKSWDEGEICLDIVFGPCDSLGPFFNIAVASGMTPTGTEVMDTSHNGSNPDPEGDGPGDNSDPTGPVFFPENPQLTITKDAVSAVSNGDGSYSLVYEINIENTGDVQLNNVQLSDTLSNAFADPCIIDYNVTSGRFTLNPNYGVADDWSLFDGLDTLQAGDQGSVLINVTVSDCGSVGTFNNVAMSTATSPSDSMVVSMDDADVTLAETPVIGLAKRISFTEQQFDGSVDITYEFRVENFGDVALDAIQVTDDLNLVFSPCAVQVIEILSDEFTPNLSYNGGVSDNMLLVGDDKLNPGEGGTIIVRINVSECGAAMGPFMNTATAFGTSPTGNTVMDVSQDGSEPDPDNDGPGDNDETTDITFNFESFIGLAKAVQYIDINPLGYVDISFKFVLQNYGNTDLDSINLFDDVVNFFDPCSVEILATSSSPSLIVNPNYDGGYLSDTILVGPNNELLVGETKEVTIVYRFRDCGTGALDFCNQAFVTARDALGQSLADFSDLSQFGPDPDPDGDNNPTNNNECTGLTFGFNPAVGIAKRISEGPTPIGDGCFDLTYEIRVENLGDRELENIQISDDLATVFGMAESFNIISVESEEFTVTPDYTGTGANLSLLVGRDTLTLQSGGNEGVVYLKINVCPGEFLGPYNNTAIVTAMAGDSTLVDNSQNGPVPDPEFEGDATDNNEPTPVSFEFNPSLGAAKRVSSGPNQATNGCYDLSYEIRVRNYGDVTLDSVQVLEDLTSVFNIPSDVVTIVGLSSAEFMVNDNFDGISDMNLLLGIDELTSEEGGEEGTINLILNICPDGNTDEYFNSVIASGDVPDGTMVMDSSQFGSDPNPSGSGDPNDDNEPTPVQLDCAVPSFVNCDRPPIVVDAPEGWCSAFANFSPPEASAQCGLDTIIQVDNTGLGSGSLFPVGTTILKWVAQDVFGNESTDTCEIKIVVNDFHTPPTIVCLDDITVGNDPLVCGAIVTNIGLDESQITDNCPDNLSITYMVEDESGQIIGNGVADASGFNFPSGINTVTYTAKDQPLLLITEVIQDGLITGIEITNFGPASYDISCLEIGRLGTMEEEFIVDDILVLGVGDTYTQLFSNINVTDPAGYYIGFIDNQIDYVAINGYVNAEYEWTGVLNGSAFSRNGMLDTDSASDWLESNTCDESTFGILDPSLATLPDNMTVVGLQGKNSSEASCSFTVTVLDVEAPYCSEFDTLVYIATDIPMLIDQGLCTVSTINVSENFVVGDASILNLEGSIMDAGDLIIKLVSPEGSRITLIDNICTGTMDFDIDLDDEAANSLASAGCDPLGQGQTFQPLQAFSAFIGESSFGDWTLEIFTNGPSMGMLNNWGLQLLEQIPYSQMDTTLNNDLGLCSADFMWQHPIASDNCGFAQITLSYFREDGLPVPPSMIVQQGTDITETFNVGVTSVIYTLIDMAGNESTCGFDVSVADIEAPVLDPVVCQDILVTLGPGECETEVVYPIPIAQENCGIDSIYYDPPPGTLFEIGVTEVTLIILDGAGNADTCTFDVIVEEFTPDNNNLVCVGNLNLSLGANCMAYITADLILLGNQNACFDDYCVTLFDEDNNIIGTSQNSTNKVDLSHVGQIITVVVCTDCEDPLSNCCSTTINIEEKLLPQVICPPDTTIQCNENDNPEITGYPEVISCEEEISITYDDEYIENGICNEPRAEIIRTWKIEDESGNIVTCVQNIVILPFNFDHVEFPEDLVLEKALDCDDVILDPTLVDTSNTGIPSINGESIFGEHLCEVNVGYWDEYLDDANCSQSYEILRHWIVRNECAPLEQGINPLRHIQAIKVNDSSSPVFELCHDDVNISVDLWSCTGTYEITPLDYLVNDKCSSDVFFEVKSSTGTVISENDNFTITNLPLGVHTVTLKANDGCRNYSSCSFNIEVVDRVPPVVVCDAHLVVSLSSNGEALIPASILDDGSFDQCTDIKIEIAREKDNCGYQEDLIWGESIKVCCEDIDSSPIKVALRVWDDSDNDGIYGTEGDNMSMCWTEIEVQYKLEPEIYCIPDAVIECDEDYLDLNLTGAPGAFSPCGDSDVYYEDILVELNSCGLGEVVRRWKVLGSDQFICDQLITILPKDPISSDNLFFPDDTVFNCIEDVVVEDPLIIGGICDVVGINIESDTFRFVNEACYKIVTKYTVIDWCQYDPNVIEPQGIWVHYQEIDVIDDTVPVITSCEDRIIDNNSETCELSEFEISNSGTDSGCGSSESLRWTYEIDLDFDGIAEMSGSLIGADVSTIIEQNIQDSVKVTWIVNDGCGNYTGCTQILRVKDTKSPTPYCQNIAVALDEEGSAEIWAIDFNAGSYDNCTSQEDLIYSFSGEEVISSRTFTCDGILNGVDESLDIEIWVWDEEGNKDFCVTRLDLQDNMDVCPDALNARVTIAGTLSTEYGEPLEGGIVRLDGPGGEYPIQRITTDNGSFEFLGNPINGDYTIGAEKTNEILNGVSTLDLVFIQRHILGQDTLDSPYKVIASDINNNLKVSASDLLELRKTILGINDKFPNNDSWRFIDRNDVFEDPMKPFPFDEKFYFEDLNVSQKFNDFIAVKIGDVTGNATAKIGSKKAVVRSDRDVTLQYYISRSNGNTKIDVYTADPLLMRGFQMKWKDLGISDIIVHSGQLSISNEYIFQDEDGTLSMSWDGVLTGIVNDQEPLFSLSGKGNMQSEIILDNAMKPEAYLNNELSIHDIVIEPRSRIEERFMVSQNIPNPFVDQTKIIITTPTQQKIRIEVANSTGVLLFEENHALRQGRNDIKLYNEGRLLPGVYYFIVYTQGEIITRKMVVVR